MEQDRDEMKETGTRDCELQIMTDSKELSAPDQDKGSQKILGGTADLSEVKVYRCFQNTLQQISFSFSPVTDRVSDHCCYLFHIPSMEQLLVWIGRMSSIEDSQLVEKILHEFSQELNCSNPPLVSKRLDEIPSEVFQASIGSAAPTVSHEEPMKNESIQVYQYDNLNSSEGMRQIASFHPNSASYSTKLPMSLLDDQLALVIESSLSVFLWIGQHCPLDPTALLKSTTLSFSSLQKSISLIRQGTEPPPLLFKLLFHHWDPDKIITSFSTLTPSSTATSPTRRKSLVAERRQSFTKHNSVPNLSSILPQRQGGSFYQKVQNQSEGHSKWSLASRSVSSDSMNHTGSRATSDGEGESLVQREAERIERQLSEAPVLDRLEMPLLLIESQPSPMVESDSNEGDCTPPVTSAVENKSANSPLVSDPLQAQQADDQQLPSAQELEDQDQEQARQDQLPQMEVQGDGDDALTIIDEPAPVQGPEEEDQQLPHPPQDPEPLPLLTAPAEGDQLPRDDKPPLAPSAEVSSVAAPTPLLPVPAHPQDDQLPPSPPAVGQEVEKPLPKKTSPTRKKTRPTRGPLWDGKADGEAPEERSPRSTIPVHQKNQCYCM
jgi:hypothetical protein